MESGSGLMVCRPAVDVWRGVELVVVVVVVVVEDR